MNIRLANPGQFFDPETGFRIAQGETKELAKIGALTRQWLNGGGLVICAEVASNQGEPVTVEPILLAPEPAPAKETTKEVQKRPVGRQPKNPKLDAEVTDEAKALFAECSLDTLRTMAKERGMSPRKTMSGYLIAKNIVAYDHEHKEADK
jgi:hypothetical protein